MKRFFSRTEMAPAFVYKLYGHGGRSYGCCGEEACGVAEGSGRTAYRETSTRHLSSGGGGGRLRTADFVGTTGGNPAPCSRSVHPFGHGAAVSKTGEIVRQKAAGTQSRPSRQSPPDSRSHRSASEPSSGSLSALLGSVEALCGNANATTRRTFPKASSRWSPNTRSIATGVPAAGKSSSRWFPTPCRTPPWATARWP